jgi:aconitate hydratase
MTSHINRSPGDIMNSFHSRARLTVGGAAYEIHRLDALEKAGVGHPGRLPWSLRVLLENLLRREDGAFVTRDDIASLASWDPARRSEREIAFMPARVLLQDFTGVPAVADLAAMRDAIVAMGGDPGRINPLQPADLVIDHSVQVDVFGTPDALRINAEYEFQRNRERYLFLRWGQHAFRNFRVVPPDTGIVHQVNLENLARVVFHAAGPDGTVAAYPDTVVGTDSHTTMINGLGVVGWGVGGIEAEAAMLGQPISMLVPEVVGVKLTGALPAGSTATDLVLTLTQMLRARGVVGSFVEYFGDGVAALSLPDRATLANMAPEYGATIGFFPVDDETLRYLRLTGRSSETVALAEAYCKEQGLFRGPGSPEPLYADVLPLDLGSVQPSLAGPRRPQDRIPLAGSRPSFRQSLANALREKIAEPQRQAYEKWAGADGAASDPRPLVPVSVEGKPADLRHGSVVIAAITSCTNTSNPAVMLGAGILATKAAARGLRVPPHVKTSLAPGSQVVADYLAAAGLMPGLETLGFHLVGYGCTTCIGNSGPLPDAVSSAIKQHDLWVASVLSGNRNFEGRVNPHVRANYLASPPLVVAYALAGDMDRDLVREPLGHDPAGAPVFLKDIWPSEEEIQEAAARVMDPEMYQRRYESAFEGDERWRSLEASAGSTYTWDPSSTYIKKPPFFEAMPAAPVPLGDIAGARALAWLGDSVTTDHISPAGSIPQDSPAGKYLMHHGVKPADFNSFGSRRGNHEVMMRGTFGSIRLRNRLAAGTEGAWTTHFPDRARLTIFDAAMAYRGEGVPLIVLAGKEYGTGSSRDWAAKGPALLGVRAVIAESFERIHRSNLAGMGVLPLQFLPGETAASLGLSGDEVYSVEGISAGLSPQGRARVSAQKADGSTVRFEAIVRLDTPQEVVYHAHGGILPYVLRSLVAA